MTCRSVDISTRRPENRGVRFTLVVPCFNEAARLDAEEFASAARRHERLRFIFVNDGSTDDTRSVLAALTSRLGSRGTVLDLKQNSGKAEAVRAGINEALQSDADVIGFWDADLATPFSELPRFLELLGDRSELDMVIGSRVKLMGRQIERRAARHYLGRIAATGISNVLGLAIYDTQCGAKLFRVNDALRTAMAEPFVSRWIFDVEILARYLQFYRRAGVSAEQRIYELPLLRWVDIDGSKVRGKDFVRAGLDLLKIARRYSKTK